MGKRWVKGGKKVEVVGKKYQGVGKKSTKNRPKIVQNRLDLPYNVDYKANPLMISAEIAYKAISPVFRKKSTKKCKKTQK